MTIISGVLQNGLGEPINGLLLLRAMRTTSNVIENTYIQTNITNGQYHLNLQPCEYDTWLVIEGYNKNTLGTIQILADTPDGSLNDLLINPTNAEIITPEILQQVIELRDQTKKYADTIDLSKFINKSGDAMYGQLIADTSGIKFPIDNKASVVISANDDGFLFQYHDVETGQKHTLLQFKCKQNQWDFENTDNVTINNKTVLKMGDFGLGALMGAVATNFNDHLVGGFYQGRSTSFPELSGNNTLTLIVYPSNSSAYRVEQIAVVNGEKPNIYYRCKTAKGAQPLYEVITTANSTVDSNGTLKKASPIVQLFANDDIDAVDGFTQSGCGLVNNMAHGVKAIRIDVGHYEIHGSLGFAKDGWYITLPEDANGNKKIFAEYSVNDNVITVKTYTRKFSTKLCKIVAGEPIDIPDGRWIDLRLDMPERTEQDELIPSVLNPIVTNDNNG
ncbi:prophage tail fiber N-terminal domain-containing protein [Gilliamella sp. B2840]|uniref:phage tail fiber protein n=2 Tax=Gilliamella TaxID=1193503 RepID=UPI00226A8BE6|nr:prophage tail fiber N-terminal domain-containing protein [Gilliamella sp. B2840]MCX8700798.1 prophage tail fiber N-terminal domain-containing protein [Gilliamella sp. B2840]